MPARKNIFEVNKSMQSIFRMKKIVSNYVLGSDLDPVYFQYRIRIRSNIHDAWLNPLKAFKNTVPRQGMLTENKIKIMSS